MQRNKPFWARFSPIQHGRESNQENDQPTVGINHDNSTLRITKSVPVTSTNKNSQPNIASKNSVPPEITGGLSSPTPNEKQPETRSLTIGKRTHQESNRQTLLPSWSTQGERAHNLIMQALGHSGKAGEKLIPLDLL